MTVRYDFKLENKLISFWLISSLTHVLPKDKCLATKGKYNDHTEPALRITLRTVSA